jgi:hypothetical protein
MKMGKPLRIPEWATPIFRLRLREGPDGRKYLIGTWGLVRVFVFRNPEKHDDQSASDFVVCFAKNQAIENSFSQPDPPDFV